MKVPVPTPIESLPDNVRMALFELVAYACNRDADSLLFDLKDLDAKGVPLPDFEISVIRQGKK